MKVMMIYMSLFGFRERREEEDPENRKRTKDHDYGNVRLLSLVSVINFAIII